MTKKNENVKEVTKTKVEANVTTKVRYRTPDGLIFMSREDYLDYMEGLRN